MGVNGVPVAPHGLILGENEATPSKKLLKHLPDLKTAINIKQITKTLPINRPSGRYVTLGRFYPPQGHSPGPEECAKRLNKASPRGGSGALAVP